MICQRTQEEIAWGRELGDEAEAHWRECPDCQGLRFELSALADDLEHELASGGVPLGFADRVMELVQDEAEAGEPLGLRTAFSYARAAVVAVALLWPA